MRLQGNRLRSQWAAIVHDLLMIPAAWLLSYWLRFNLREIPPELLQTALQYLLIVVPVQFTVCGFFGLYRGVWRFTSLPDLMRILKSVLVGVGLSVALLFLFYRLEGMPRSVPVLYAILLGLLLSGPRLLYRWLKDRHFSLRSGKRVLIVGAGQAGEMLARDLLRNVQEEYLPVAFVDDRARRQGQEIHGIPVAGTTSAIPDLVVRLGIEVIVLAVPSASVQERKQLIALCEQTGVPFRTVPQLDSLMSGQVAINQLREVSIEDLLGRAPVALSWDAIRQGLAGRVILITGAGGSIGSELCRQIARIQPERLVLFENSEFNLYAIELELRQRFPDLTLHAVLGDVRDDTSVDAVFADFTPSVVFHAAAYKHVPMLEQQVREAVRNNVLGTRRVAEAADRHGCSQFVLISTDKAVNPANVMGTTKRVAELFCQNLNARSTTRFITVRFGNVLGSAGSVVPLFRQQIADGGPVTVTHAEIERYFMTIPEACQLIMQAATLGEGGEIFVLDMGEPVKIRYLAEQMIRLSGREPGRDVEIVYTGLRPGEKLYEELFHQDESLQPTGHEKILLARHRRMEWQRLCAVLDRMDSAVTGDDEKVLLSSLMQLVPENRMAEGGRPVNADAAAAEV